MFEAIILLIRCVMGLRIRKQKYRIPEKNYIRNRNPYRIISKRDEVE